MSDLSGGSGHEGKPDRLMDLIDVLLVVTFILLLAMGLSAL